LSYKGKDISIICFIFKGEQGNKGVSVIDMSYCYWYELLLWIWVMVRVITMSYCYGYELWLGLLLWVIVMGMSYG